MKIVVGLFQIGDICPCMVPLGQDIGVDEHLLAEELTLITRNLVNN